MAFEIVRRMKLCKSKSLAMRITKYLNWKRSIFTFGSKILSWIRQCCWCSRIFNSFPTFWTCKAITEWKCVLNKVWWIHCRENVKQTTINDAFQKDIDPFYTTRKAFYKNRPHLIKSENLRRKNYWTQQSLFNDNHQ